MVHAHLTRSRFNERQASRFTCGFSGWLNWAGRTHSQLQWHHSMGYIPRLNKIKKPVFVFLCNLNADAMGSGVACSCHHFFFLCHDEWCTAQPKSQNKLSFQLLLSGFLSNDKNCYDDPADYPCCESVIFHSFFNIIMAPAYGTHCYLPWRGSLHKKRKVLVEMVVFY